MPLSSTEYCAFLWLPAFVFFDIGAPPQCHKLVHLQGLAQCDEGLATMVFSSRTHRRQRTRHPPCLARPQLAPNVVPRQLMRTLRESPEAETSISQPSLGAASSSRPVMMGSVKFSNKIGKNVLEVLKRIEAIVWFCFATECTSGWAFRGWRGPGLGPNDTG
ncbi:hypothetical protein KCU61_g544, partial [Aureobasidium melanogenum]